MCSLLGKIRKFLDKILNFLLLAQKVGPSPTPIWLTLTTKLTILEMSQQQETSFFGIFGYELFLKVPFVSSDLSYFQYKSRVKIGLKPKVHFSFPQAETLWPQFLEKLKEMPENEYSFQLKHIYGDYKNAICSCYEKFRSSTGYEYLRVFFF